MDVPREYVDGVASWCALPVIRDLADDIGAAGMSLGVTDRDGSVRWVACTPHLLLGRLSWSSTAASVHDPDTGVVLGGVTVAGPSRVLTPDVASLARLAAVTVEGELRLARAAARSA